MTDEESRTMKTAGGGYDQCNNAQAIVDTASLPVVVPHVTQACNDKQQVEPMLEKLQAPPEEFNTPDTLLADTGYHSERNVMVCNEAGIEPLIAAGRESHHPHWKERFSEPEPLPKDATPVERMKHTLTSAPASLRCSPTPSNPTT